jgi:hypothetical protein
MSNINTWGGTVTKGTAKPQFIVRRSWISSTLIMWLGLGAFGIGLLGAILQSSIAPDADGTVFAMLIGASIPTLPVGLILNRSRITVYDERYDVRPGLGRKRRRDVKDLDKLRFGRQSSQNGTVYITLTGWNEQQKKQFRIHTTHRGYAEFTAWLAQHRPEQWAKCESLGIPD